MSLAVDKHDNRLGTQRTQYPFIKEYTVNYTGPNLMVYKVYSLI